MPYCPDCKIKFDMLPSKVQVVNMQVYGELVFRTFVCPKSDCRKKFITIEIGENVLEEYIFKLQEKMESIAENAGGPDNNFSYKVYASKRRNIFHRKDCVWLELVFDPMEWGDREASIRDGFHPCRTCNS